MFRAFWITLLALVAFAVVWAAVKAILMLAVLAVILAVGLPLISLWLGPERRRHWRGWKAAVYARAFAARSPRGTRR